jgi:hypothetical protein
MSLLNDIYMLCAVGGFLYLVGTAALGFANMDHGGGSEGADGGADAGDAGGADAGDAGGADAGDAGGADAGDAGGADAGDAGGADLGDLRHAQRTGLAHARTATSAARRRGRRLNIGLLVLKITSPYTVACFAFFFGLTGLILSKYAPFLPALIIILPATISGVIGYNALTAVMNAVADKLYASSTYREEDLIGHVGELTLPISAGSTGEIIYLTGKTRGTAPAKAKDATAAIKRESKVIIADVVDGVFIVEPFTD